VCALGGGKAHDGGIYAISWSPDSTRLLSASGDKTSKIWDVNVNSVVSTFTMGSTLLPQAAQLLVQNGGAHFGLNSVYSAQQGSKSILSHVDIWLSQQQLLTRLFFPH